MSPFLQTIGGGSAKGFKGSGGGVLLGGDESMPAATAQAILDAGASQGDGVYWITVNGTARQMYCDMTSGGKAWMATYRVDADGQSSCANGTWDFNAQSNLGVAAPTTTAGPTRAGHRCWPLKASANSPTSPCPTGHSRKCAPRWSAS